MFGINKNNQNRTLRNRTAATTNTNNVTASSYVSTSSTSLIKNSVAKSTKRAVLADLSNNLVSQQSAHENLKTNKSKGNKKIVSSKPSASLSLSATQKQTLALSPPKAPLTKEPLTVQVQGLVTREPTVTVPKKKKTVAPTTRKTRSSDAASKSVTTSSDQITDIKANVQGKRKSRAFQQAAAQTIAPKEKPTKETKEKIIKENSPGAEIKKSRKNSRQTDVEDKHIVAKHLAKKPRTALLPHDDLDADDIDDPMMVSEYVEEIFVYLKELEVATLPNPDYMDNQKELEWKMRAILVDWMIEVHTKFRLLPETLYLAVNILDRFLSSRVVSLVKLQLVGVTSLFIASKYEEVMSPSIQSFLFMAEDGFSEEEIVRAERYVLQVLKFNMQYPTPMSFLRRSSKADDYDIQTRTLAKYLMEVTLLDHRFLGISASLVAATAHYLARHMLDRGEWSHNLVYYSGYALKDLDRPTELILDFLSKPLKFQAVFKKYSQRKFMKGALFVKDWISSRISAGLHPVYVHPMNILARKTWLAKSKIKDADGQLAACESDSERDDESDPDDGESEDE